MSQRERDTNSFLFFIVWVNWPFKISENKREKTWANFSDFSDLPAGLCCRLALSWVLLADGGNYIKLDGCFRINQSIQWEHRKGRWRLWAHRANTACSASTPFTGMERVRRWSYWWRTWLALHYQFWTPTCWVSCSRVSAGRTAMVSQLQELIGSLWLPAPANRISLIKIYYMARVCGLISEHIIPKQWQLSCYWGVKGTNHRLVGERQDRSPKYEAKITDRTLSKRWSLLF